MTDNTGDAPAEPPAPRRRRGWLIGGLAAVLLFATGAAAGGYLLLRDGDLTGNRAGSSPTAAPAFCGTLDLSPIEAVTDKTARIMSDAPLPVQPDGKQVGCRIDLETGKASDPAAGTVRIAVRRFAERNAARAAYGQKAPCW